MPCATFCNMLFLYGGELLALANPQAGGLPLVGCPRRLIQYTGQFKQKVTLPHVYNEVTSEPTITLHASIVRRALKVLIRYLTNTQCGNPVSHGTRQSDGPFLSRLSPACPVSGCHSGDDALSQFLKIIWQGWYVDDVLKYPRERSRTLWGLAHHRRCDNHKQGHAGKSLDRNGLSDWRVPCDTGFPHCVFVR
jgi:hypothetical protein